MKPSARTNDAAVRKATTTVNGAVNIHVVGRVTTHATVMATTKPKTLNRLTAITLSFHHFHFFFGDSLP